MSGWEPRTSFRDGIARTLEFYRATRARGTGDRAGRDTGRRPRASRRRGSSPSSPLQSIACSASGTYLLGPELDAFETELAAFTGRRHAVGVASGTDALRLALLAVGVGPGDEVIVPAFTAVPTAAAVCATGASPVFVDVDPDTAALDRELPRLAP